jgi:hypothetical protein
MFWMGKLLQQECVVRGVYFVPSRRTLSERGEKVDESPSGALDLVLSRKASESAGSVQWLEMRKTSQDYRKLVKEKERVGMGLL